MITDPPPRFSLPVFFGLILALSLPFWVAGALVPVDKLPIKLPISALMAVNPTIAALILIWRANGSSGTKQFLKRALAVHRLRPRRWFAVSFLIMPGLLGLAYAMAVLLGYGTPNPSFPLGALAMMSIVFFIAAFAEEIGWQGYAFEPLQARWGLWGAGLRLGVVWALWHIIPFIQTGNPLWWIVWQSIYTVLFRMLIGWGYVVTDRSVFAAVLLHATSNIAAFMTPNYGSGYNPLLATLCVSAVLMVISLYRSKRFEPGHKRRSLTRL
jgi:membrane protease YdiL (CAAX protease family)